jgi:hypothetical protein
MLAHQVAAKAVRDAYFLTVFPVTDLPAMVITAALVSVTAVPIYSRLLARFGPHRVVPAGFIISATAHVAEWFYPDLTRGLAVVIYLHLAALGALLLSGFWSLASETFDPITAKRSYGQIAAAGTLGGIAGGLVAERMAAMLPPHAVLLFLAALHVACGTMALRLVGRDRDVPTTVTPFLGLDLLKTVPHVKPLALLVVLGTASASILDFLFKSQAAAQFGNGSDLLRLFAVFYVVTQTVTFAMQTWLTDRSLLRHGVGGTIGALPASVAAGSVAALFVPALPLFAFARGLEAVVRGSLFRSGYELLFTPMGPALKRRAKTFLDVACDRAGDAVGAGLVQLLLLAAPVFLVSELLGVVVGMTALSLWIARRLNAFYAREVERRLVDHAGSLRFAVDATGWASQPSVLGVEGSLTGQSTPAATPTPPLDAATLLLGALRSGNRSAVLLALRDTSRLDASHVAQVVSLLAWDDVRLEAQQTLEAVADRHVGLLLDQLLSPDTEFAVRRRLPRIVGRIASQRALNGLLAGLDDSRFEVRYRCSRAIDGLLAHHPELHVDRRRIFDVLARELSVPRSISSSYAVLDPDDASDPAFLLDPQAGANRDVEYVFSLLAAVLPREPLKAAYRAVHTNDRLLRGLSLDYLNSVLPEELRASFLAILDVDAETVRHVEPGQALTDLLQSHEARSVRPSASDAHGQSGPPPATTPPSGSH